MSSTNVVKESSPAVRRARRRHRRRTGGQNALLGPSNDGNLPKIKENSWSTDDAGESHDADTSGEGVPVTGSSDKIIASQYLRCDWQRRNVPDIQRVMLIED